MFFAPLLVFVILWVKDGSNTELINQSLERENNFFNFSLTAEKLSNQTVSFENWKKKSVLFYVAQLVKVVEKSPKVYKHINNDYNK